MSSRHGLCEWYIPKVVVRPLLIPQSLYASAFDVAKVWQMDNHIILANSRGSSQKDNRYDSKEPHD